MRSYIIPLSLLIVLLLIQNVLYGQSETRVWYDAPAGVWEANLPLGNGRLGAMPDNRVDKETIVLNEITLWSGSPQDADNPEAPRYLPQIRNLLFAGKNDLAETLMHKTFVCKGAGSGHGKGADVPYGSYQVLGNLELSFKFKSNKPPENYMRELLLDSALARCHFDKDGIRYEREYFTDFSNDVVIIRLKAGKEGALNFTANLKRPERFSVAIAGDELQMSGQLNNGADGKGMRYLVRIRIIPEGGKLAAKEDMLEVKKANSAIIYISAATDFRGNDFESQTTTLLKKAMETPYEKSLKNHAETYQRLFKRASLHLENESLNAAIPTDERLKAYVRDMDDNGLPELYFNFGRYLLISSTRPGLLPPNLQGLWARTIQTPWNGDYHLDVNIQMNHWPLNVANLPMLNEPFEKLVTGLVEPGSKTAKVYYDGDGWVAHVITNVWGYTSPGEHPSWGATNSGSGWLCEMLWRHYAFTGDEDYLKDIYPILKGSAEFYLSTLVEDPNTHWLVTAPSNSPENSFILPNGKVVHVCMGPTVDNQIIRTLFHHVMEASEMFGVDEELAKKLSAAADRLPPNRIGNDGRLMEWLKEYRETEPRHRHVSHLWGMYPGNEITLHGTPELADAVRKSLEKRGDDGTGWSLAWKVNLWARLGNGDRAFKLLHALLRPAVAADYNMVNGGGTYPNLFCAHPPYQIDGNFGGAAGIAEMLLQSHEGFINFLPALPSLWEKGHFEGFGVRGGGTVSALWENGLLQTASLVADHRNTFRIRLPEKAKTVNTVINGQAVTLTPGDGFINISMIKGQLLEMEFGY